MTLKGQEMPVTRKVAHSRVHHSDTFIDNYEWLRDKSSPEVIAHLNEENAYTESKLAHLSTLRETIYSEIKARVKETDLSVPSRHAQHWYYSRTLEGQEYPLSCRAPVENDEWVPPSALSLSKSGQEEIIFDANAESKRLGAGFFTLGASDISEDGTKMLYAYDITGDERYELHVRDLSTNTELADVIKDVTSAMFDVTGEYIFYTKADDAWRSFQVYRHRLGSLTSDVLIYQEDDERNNVGIGVTRDKKYLVLESSSKVTDEVHLLDAKNPEGDFEVFWKRQEGVEYDVETISDGDAQGFLVTHNRDSKEFDIDFYSSPSQKVGRFLSSANATDEDGVQSSEDPGSIPQLARARLLPGVSIYKNFLVVSFKQNTLVRSFVLMRSDFEADPLNPEKHWREIRPSNLELFSLGVGASEYEAPLINYAYSSYTTPNRLMLLDPTTWEETLLKEAEVLPLNGVPYDKSLYNEKRLWATSIGEDGNPVQVPISLVYKGDYPEDRPCLLYGYGSYGASESPRFSTSRLSLLDRGVVFAVAHVRGGSELGYSWYEDGKMLSKKNTFYDFIACAKHLISENITTSKRLVISGGSAGGLLVGAAVNMAPDLFAGAEVAVGFVDPLTSILMPELPLTVPEWEEWGNPLHDEKVYQYMKSYSPYENISVQNVDQSAHTIRILATTSLNDTRVLYVEPAKWCARLREFGYDPLLKCEMEAGHGGVSGRYKAWREVAFTLAWELDVMGIR
jgi:oligopeptidase B